METGRQHIEGYALSPQQRRLWQVQQTIGDDVIRCEFTVSIDGLLDRARLHAALRMVIAQHEILRTTFRYVPSLLLPVQVVAPVSDESVPLIHEVDLQESSPEATERFMAQLFQAGKPSSPDDPPKLPLRAALLTFDSQRHALFISLPALCADASTAGILAGEIARAYGASEEDQELETEQFQYAQFAHWQNELAHSQDGRSARDYWERQSFTLPVIPLSKAGSDTNEHLFQPGSITFEIESDIVGLLEQTAREAETEISAILLTSWQVLLSRLRLDSTSVLGCAMDGRKYAELDQMPGLLSQYLPIRVPLDEDLSFRDLVRQVDAAVSEAYEWQEGFRFEPHDAESGDTAGLKFFPVCFSYQETAKQFLSQRVSFSVAQLQSFTDLFNLRLSVQRGETTLLASLDFNLAVLAEEEVRRFADCFQALLRSAAGSPDSSVHRLNILSEEMQHELLVTFNSTRIEIDIERLTHELFEDQVVRTPGNIAVECGAHQLTYTELNARADELAQRLQSLGVCPEVVVAVLIEHSVELIVAILGVLKAGGAYLPLDPLYPEGRLAFMLADTQAAVLLTQDRLRNSLPPSDAKVIYLDRLMVNAQEHGAHSSHASTCQVAADNLAYVIYTSGSTGQPKGAMISHRGLSNYLRWCIEAYRVKLGEGAPLHSSIAFDLSITSLFAPLLTGRSVFLTPASEPGVDAFANLLRERDEFSFIKVTPAHAALLSQQLRRTEVAKRTRVMILGGEALTAQDIAYWRECAPETTIFNEYGPTETVVGCCIFQAHPLNQSAPQLKQSRSSIPIGRPISNTQVYVLDGEMELVPLAVEGELYIGGAGLARGYWQRADLTAERFVPHPFTEETGERLYRTGDRVRWRSDGELEFLGRLDEQVKLRGYRIELGEIEAVLGDVPGVEGAVVIVREEQPGDKRLVAYVVRGQEAEGPDVGQLREALIEKLPVYMVPAHIVLLERLPLTVNGKLDRKALPAPEQAVSQTNGYVAPRTPVEEMLCGIFCEVLQRGQVSVVSDFFELGGHSLLATQVISRVNNAFSVEIPIRTLFETATVRGLAETLQKLSQNGQKPSRPPIKPLPRTNHLSAPPEP